MSPGDAVGYKHPDKDLLMGRVIKETPKKVTVLLWDEQGTWVTMKVSRRNIYGAQPPGVEYVEQLERENPPSGVNKETKAEEVADA